MPVVGNQESCCGWQREKGEPRAPKCGIDLQPRDCWLAILDDGLKVVREAKVGNDLEALIHFLEP